MNLSPPLAGLLFAASVSSASAAVKVFECQFPADNFKFVVTIFDDGSPARVGVETGIGNLAQPYFDPVTKAWIIVEFIDQGKLPSTLTTILADGTVYHSRHSMDVLGLVIESQMKGKCAARTIP